MHIRKSVRHASLFLAAALSVAWTSARAYPFPGAAQNLPTLVDSSDLISTPDRFLKRVNGTSAVTRSDDTSFFVWSRYINDNPTHNTGTTYILGKRFSSDGQPVGDDETLFNPVPTSFGFPETSAAINHNDVMVVGYWIDGALKVRTFSRDGLPLIPEVLVGVSPDRSLDTKRPAVAIADDGRFAFAWVSVKLTFVGNTRFETKKLNVQRFTNRGEPDGKVITVSQERSNSILNTPSTQIDRLDLAYDRQNILSVSWLKGNGGLGEIYLSSYDDRGRRVGPLLALVHPPVLKDVTKLGFYIDASDQRHIAYQTSAGAYAKQTFDASGVSTAPALPITGILLGHKLRSVTGLSDGSFLLYTTVDGPYEEGVPPDIVRGYQSRPYTQWRDANGMTMRNPTEFGVSGLLHPTSKCASSVGSENIYAVVCELSGATVPFKPYDRLYVEMHSLK